MQSLQSEHQAADDIPHEKDTPIRSLSITTKKRCRDTPTVDETTFTNQTEQPYEALRAHISPQKVQASDQFGDPFPLRDISFANDQRDQYHDNPDVSQKTSDLKPKQRKFVRQWFDAFVKSEPDTILSNESMSALATLTQARPQLIIEYIKITYPKHTEIGRSTSIRRPDTIPSLQHSLSSSQELYALSTANAHLTPATLSLVTRYINSCRRPRPHIDGRRSVNTGPYRCTFGCGYRTKRSFDWRRHEETHEPQELWLCTLCYQNNTHDDIQIDSERDRIASRKEPFLVSRKDKFLKHAKESHKEWGPEKVLGLSKVDYRPNVDLGCPKCGTVSKTWDERCKHVLGHFEDEAEQGSKRPRLLYEASDEGKASVEGSVASSIVSCDDSDDEDRKQHLGDTG